MIVFIPYITEILMALGFDWVTDDPEGIPISRKFLKSLYMTSRIICYFVFLFRVLVIYSNWKLRNTKKGISMIFRSEEKMVLVRFYF
jgi:ABC-type branched-subunit amino acid transport system permease subunit